MLKSVILTLLTINWGPGLTPVYAKHLRNHPDGADARAEELADQLRRAAMRAGVDLALLTALAYTESALDHGRRSVAGAAGALQLLPSSRWGRAARLAARAAGGPGGGRAQSVAERLNVLWGAYALADGLMACDGYPTLATGFYRAGRCLSGPRGRLTVALARVIRRHLGQSDRASL